MFSRGTVQSPVVVEHKLKDTSSGKGAEMVNFKSPLASAVSRSIAFKLQDNVSVKDFGAVGDGVTDDTLAIQAAFDASNNVYLPSPSLFYLVTDTLVVGSNKVIAGAGMSNTNIQGQAVGTPTKIIEFSNATKSIVKDLNVTWLGATDAGISMFQSNKCTVDRCGGNALNQDSGLGTTHGYFIKMDMGVISYAYKNTIKNCDSQGADFFVHSTGPITDCTFKNNKGRSANGYRFIRGIALAGSAPIAGNRIYGNLIQAYSAATYGTGVGIDWGVGDAASPVHSYANFIRDNYIERWSVGILFREGATNNYVGSQEWDNNTSDITDSNPNKDGYSEFAGTKKHIKIAEFTKEFKRYGDKFTDATSGDVSYDGNTEERLFTGDGETVSINARVIRINGNGGARTGAILDKPIDNTASQRVTLLGPTWGVAFLATNTDPAVPFTMGNSVTEYATRTFLWDVPSQKWMTESQVVR